MLHTNGAAVNREKYDNSDLSTVYIIPSGKEFAPGAQGTACLLGIAMLT